MYGNQQYPPPRSSYFTTQPPKSCWFYACTIVGCIYVILLTLFVVTMFVLWMVGVLPTGGALIAGDTAAPFTNTNMVTKNIAPSVPQQQKKTIQQQVPPSPAPAVVSTTNTNKQTVNLQTPLTFPFIKVTGEGLQSNPSVVVNGGSSGISLVVENGGAEIKNGHIYAMGPITSGTRTSVPSDRRIKQNIFSLNDTICMDIVKQIQPRSFTFTEEWHKFNPFSVNDGEQLGFIAQELESVLPQAVTILDSVLFEDGLKVVDKTSLIPLLVGSVRELERRTRNLEQVIDYMSKKCK